MINEPCTINEAKRCIKGLTLELLETQRSLIKAYEIILNGEHVRHEVVMDSSIHRKSKKDDQTNT